MIQERSANPDADPHGSTHWGLLNRQRRAVMEELGSVADVMRGAASKLEGTEEAEFGIYVRKAANYVEGLSSSLGERDLEELLHQTEDSVRERPALTLGLTAGVGFVIGRFLKARSQRTKPAGEGA